MTGDWDGNGRTDLGVWHPATAQFSQRIAPGPERAGHRVPDAGLRHAAQLD